MDRPTIEPDGVRMRVRRVTSALTCSTFLNRPQNLRATDCVAVPPPKQSKQLIHRHLRTTRINFSRFGAHFLIVLRHFKVDDVIAAPLRSRGKTRLIVRVTSLISVGLQCRNITWPNRATLNVQLEEHKNSPVTSEEWRKEQRTNEWMNIEHW
jgi:hypothetical protein